MLLSQTARAMESDSSEPLYAQMRKEAESAIRRDPVIASFLQAAILRHDRLEQAVIHRVSARLAHEAMSSALVLSAFEDMIAHEPSARSGMLADILAVIDRDPACARLIEPLLYFKGFHALQTHRLAHWLWRNNRKDFALYLQSRSSEVFQTDINPAARIGNGVFLDHATGLVVGATAEIDDNVSIMQGVTLGGTGKEKGDRHPKIRCGVLIGAGAKVIGNIEIGHCARIAAGSVVLKPVPPNKTVAGVPAQIMGDSGCPEPARSMDQLLRERPAVD